MNQNLLAGKGISLDTKPETQIDGTTDRIPVEEKINSKLSEQLIYLTGYVSSMTPAPKPTKMELSKLRNDSGEVVALSGRASVLKMTRQLGIRPGDKVRFLAYIKPVDYTWRQYTLLERRPIIPELRILNITEIEKLPQKRMDDQMDRNDYLRL